MSEQDTVSFGFEEVTPDEKVDRVKGVFRSVASKYDVMNDFMSAGVHRLWKHDTMNRVNPQPGERHLDVAGGTGELARAFLRLADEAGKRRGDTRQATAIVCDINDAMLEAGKARGDNAEWAGRLDWVCADGTALPYPDRSFDALTISFGIRNFADRVAGLREFKRVLKPGGRLCLTGFIVEPGMELAQAVLPLIAYRDGAWTADPNEPERAIGYERAVFEAWLQEAGLVLAEPVEPGHWSRPVRTGEFQDRIIVEKRPSGLS